MSISNFGKKFGKIEIFCPAGEKVRKNRDFKKGSFSRFRGSYGEKTHFLSFSPIKFSIFCWKSIFGRVVPNHHPTFFAVFSAFSALDCDAIKKSGG